VYDLTCDSLDEEEMKIEGGKIYLPPVLDMGSGMLHVF
jgi:hypothetical protein